MCISMFSTREPSWASVFFVMQQAKASVHAKWVIGWSPQIQVHVQAFSLVDNDDGENVQMNMGTTHAKTIFQH